MWWYNRVFRTAPPIFISYLLCRRIYDGVQPRIRFSSEIAYSCTIRELCNHTTRLHNADPPHFGQSSHVEVQQLTFVGFRAKHGQGTKSQASTSEVLLTIYPPSASLSDIRQTVLFNQRHEGQNWGGSYVAGRVYDNFSSDILG